MARNLKELLARREDIARHAATKEILETIGNLMRRQYPGDQEAQRRFRKLEEYVSEAHEGDIATHNRMKTMLQQLEGGSAGLEAILQRQAQSAQEQASLQQAEAALRQVEAALQQKQKETEQKETEDEWGDLQWENNKDTRKETEVPVAVYPFLEGRLSTNLLEKFGVTASYDTANKYLNVQAPSAAALLGIYAECAGGSSIVNGNNNREKLESFYKKDYSKFSEGSRQTVLDCIDGKFDQSLFLQKRAELTNLCRDLQSSYQGVENRRKRTFSEYDGEMDYDRRFERNPFTAGKREPQPIHSVTIKLDMGFAAQVSPGDIALFGAYAWAVADFIEAKGYRAEVIQAIYLSGPTTATKVDDRAQFTPLSGKYEATIKKAGKYIDTMEMAKSFTPWFYRRVWFTGMALFSDAIGRDVDYGLGGCESDWRGIQAEPGLIKIQAASAGKNIRLEQLKAAIVTSLGIQLTEIV